MDCMEEEYVLAKHMMAATFMIVSKHIVLYLSHKRKRKNSDSVLRQNPIEKSKKQRDNIKTPPKPSITNDCGPT